MSNHFGIEIECYNVGRSEAIVANDLNRSLKLSKASTLRQPDLWFVTDDGSISSEDDDHCSDCEFCDGSGTVMNDKEEEHECWECDGRGHFYESIYGAEIVSPVLEYNDESFAKVTEMYQTLRRFGGEVNDSCGLHVHVDARFVQKMPREVQQRFFRYLISEYASREEEFDLRMERDRQGDNNNYCHTMKRMSDYTDYNWTRFFQSTEDRYYKLNVHAFVRHGTVEFRHHHGTMDEDEAIAWIHTCVKFMQECREQFEGLMALEALMASDKAKEELAAMNKKKPRARRTKNNNLGV